MINLKQNSKMQTLDLKLEGQIRDVIDEVYENAIVWTDDNSVVTIKHQLHINVTDKFDSRLHDQLLMEIY